MPVPAFLSDKRPERTFPRTLSLAKHTRRLSFVRQALSHSVVVVLKTRFHCEHISALLNLGSCLLIQRVRLSKCVWVRVCVCHKLHSSEANPRHSCLYHLCLFDQTNALICRNLCRYYSSSCSSASLLSVSTSVSAPHVSHRRKSTLAVFSKEHLHLKNKRFGQFSSFFPPVKVEVLTTSRLQQHAWL